MEFFATYKLRKKERIPIYIIQRKIMRKFVSWSSALGKRNYGTLLFSDQDWAYVSDYYELKSL